MAKKQSKDDPVIEPDQITNTQIYKVLTDFIEETRNNFSAINSDNEHDYRLLQTVNQNVNDLEGKVENFSNKAGRLTDKVVEGSQEVKNEVGELKQEMSTKKVVTKVVKHFDIKLWFQNFKDSIFRK